jgi:SAM-dependent methyltransferase
MRPEYIDRIKLMGDQGLWKSPILDVGGETFANQKGQGYDMDDIFRRMGFEYVNLDIQEGEGVNIVDDACEMSKVADESYGSVMCTETLEHVNYPFKVITQCMRVLKPGGVILVSAPFLYPEHGKYDLWRFTPQGIKFLMKDFEMIEFRELGNWSHQNHECYYIGRKTLNKEIVNA